MRRVRVRVLLQGMTVANQIQTEMMACEAVMVLVRVKQMRDWVDVCP